MSSIRTHPAISASTQKLTAAKYSAVRGVAQITFFGSRRGGGDDGDDGDVRDDDDDGDDGDGDDGGALPPVRFRPAHFVPRQRQGQS